jgi:hypothetical protein
MTEREFLITDDVVVFTLGVHGVHGAFGPATMASLRGAPPPKLANQPAPAPEDAIVAVVQDVGAGDWRTLQAVSARDGAPHRARSRSGVW